MKLNDLLVEDSVSSRFAFLRDALKQSGALTQMAKSHHATTAKRVPNLVKQHDVILDAGISLFKASPNRAAVEYLQSAVKSMMTSDHANNLAWALRRFNETCPDFVDSKLTRQVQGHAEALNSISEESKSYLQRVIDVYICLYALQAASTNSELQGEIAKGALHQLVGEIK